MLRRRRLIAVLSSAALAVSGLVSVVATAAPAAAASGQSRPAAVSAPAASGHSDAVPHPLATTGQSTIEGVVSSGSGTSLGGVTVTVCGGSPGGCRYAVTDAKGFYEVSGLPAGTYPTGGYTVNASAPPLLNGANGPFNLAPGAVQTANLVLLVPSALPPGVSIPGASPGTPPIAYYGAPVPFSVGGRCANGTATFTILQNGLPVTSPAALPMTETPPGSGTYDGIIPAVAPYHHGYISVTVVVNCPGGGTQVVTFCVYLDPSGTVISPSGLPVGGATVTLLTSASPTGPFTAVPNGSSIMSPANRVNPMVTKADGQYGWDVVPGYYEVQAQKTGCVAPTSPPVPVAVSPVLQVPPAVTGLLLTLDCTGSPATSITSAGAATFTALTGGAFTLSATGTPTPTWTESGTLPAGATFTVHSDGTATLLVSAAVAAGVSTFTATAANGVGPGVSQLFTLTVNPAAGPVITSSATAGFTAGVGGTFKVTATGSSTPVLSEVGTLPPGVTFTPQDNGAAALSVSASAAPGSASITITASAGQSSTSQSFILTITAPAPAITSGSSAQFTLTPGVGGTFTVSTTGVPTPTVIEAGPLPTGVTFTPHAGGTATLAVAPGTASGTYNFTIAATSSGGPAAVQPFTLTVS